MPNFYFKSKKFEILIKSAAEFIKENKHTIIDSWETVVNHKITASEKTQSLVLRNLLPNLLEDVALIMSRFSTREEFLKTEKCEEIIQESLDHGRHRAASSRYTVKQMINEYILLNRVLVETLNSEGLFDADVGLVITFSLSQKKGAKEWLVSKRYGKETLWMFNSR